MRKTILAVLVLLSANFYTVNLFAQGKLLAKEGQAIPDSFGLYDVYTNNSIY